MDKTREPKQKRSIEKKNKIVNAGFQLFCEKGYYNTNTAEIAEYAGVSTGTLYSYFNDKTDIYVAVFENYLTEQLLNIMSTLEEQTPFSLQDFIVLWIDIYFDLFGKSNKALSELNNVMGKDKDLNKHFSSYEVKFTENIFAFLKNKDGFEMLSIEKTYLAFLLVDALCKERTTNLHDKIDYNALRNQAIATMKTILSN